MEFRLGFFYEDVGSSMVWFCHVGIGLRSSYGSFGGFRVEV